MQKLTWSNKEICQEFNHCGDLGEIITEIENSFWKKGEVICEIHVNGMYLSESDEAKFSTSKLDEIQQLEVRSNKPDDLFLESIESVIEWIPKVKSAALELSEEFRSGNKDKAVKMFPEVLDGCHWLSSALALLKSFVLKKVDLEEFSKSWTSAEVSLSLVAVEILQAYEKEDYVMLSDIIEYDLTSSLDKWLELLK